MSAVLNGSRLSNCDACLKEQLRQPRPEPGICPLPAECVGLPPAQGNQFLRLIDTLQIIRFCEGDDVSIPLRDTLHFL